MDELIAKILAMPALTLDESEWNLTIKILNNLPNKSPAAFKATLDLWLKCNHNLHFDNERLDNFLNYLKHWNEVTSLLIVKIEELSAVWKNVFFDDLGAENLVPTLIELIQCDKSTLTFLLHKIEVALRLDDSHLEACLLTNLQIAVAAKLENKQISENEKLYFEMMSKKVDIIRAYLPNAAEEVRRQLELRQYGIVCNDYKNELAEKIKAKLVKENKSRFQPLFNDAANIDHIILEIISNNHLLGIQKQSSSRALVLKNTATNEITDSEILLLFEKFKAIYDLSATCTRKKKSSEEKLEEFTEKYRMYKDILEANGDQIAIKILKAITLVSAVELLVTLLPESIRARSSAERLSQIPGVLFSNPPVAGGSTTNPARGFRAY